ncbi:MAG: fused MFS/spermidine synthase [Desulfobacteraceae bacterium]
MPVKNKTKNRKNTQKNKPAPRWMLLVTIFITGNVVMMLEIVGTRVVGPYFGVGIYVWSALITVTLLALSTGYWIGGKWADANGHPEFLFKTILTAGVFIFLVPVIRNPVLIYSGEFDVRGGVLMGSMMLFGPPLFLLGIVSPYAAKLFTEQFEKLGARVGLLYAVSTLGSFFGTINIGFYMIPNYHISTILFVLGTTLLIMPAAYAVVSKRKRYSFFVLTCISAATLLCYLAATSSQKQTGERKILYKTNSFYGEIKVTQQRDLRILLVDGVAQSGENYLTHEALPSYIETIRDSVRIFHPNAKNALVIGLGGGNIVHALIKDNILVDVVEIDKKIIFVAEKFFSINPARIKITETDGRLFRIC